MGIRLFFRRLGCPRFAHAHRFAMSNHPCGDFCYFLRQFQKSSKILETHRCDLKTERFWLVTYSVAAKNYRFNLINGDFSISF